MKKTLVFSLLFITSIATCAAQEISLKVDAATSIATSSPSPRLPPVGRGVQQNSILSTNPYLLTESPLDELVLVQQEGIAGHPRRQEFLFWNTL